MANKVRTYVEMNADSMSRPKDLPRHLSKQEFGRKLYRMMIERGWNQSDLARHAGLPRDSISTYVRAKSLPTPISLQALSRALGVKPEDLLPNHLENAMEEELPAFSLQMSTTSPGKAWVRVNRLMKMSTATKIAELIESDSAE